MPVETKDTKADPLADLLASGNAELARRADEAAAKDKKDAETVAAEWRVVALLADDLLGPLAAFVPAEPPEDFAYALKRGEAYDAQIRPHKNGLAYIELMFVRDYNPATRGSAKPWAWRAVPAETTTDDAGELTNRFHVCA